MKGYIALCRIVSGQGKSTANKTEKNYNEVTIPNAYLKNSFDVQNKSLSFDVNFIDTDDILLLLFWLSVLDYLGLLISVLHGPHFKME